MGAINRVIGSQRRGLLRDGLAALALLLGLGAAGVSLHGSLARLAAAHPATAEVAQAPAEEAECVVMFGEETC